MPNPLAAQKKRALVVDAMPGFEIAPLVTAAQTLHYRSKATYVVKRLGRRVIMGAYERGSHFVLDLSGCVVEEPAIHDAAQWLRAHLHEELRYVVMRASSRGEVLVTLIGPAPSPPAWAKSLAQQMPVASVSWSTNADAGNAIWKGAPVLLAGAPHIEEEIDGLVFRLSPQSFFQVHRAAASRLRRDLIAALGRLDKKVVWDLFCGAGANALPLAREGAIVTGVESVEAAVADARFNASRNGLSAHFEVGNLDRELLLSSSPDVVVLNPPRKGATPALVEAIIQKKPEIIAYIACAPKPVGVAARTLLQHGYVAEKIVPYDLFPHTEHVETLALFRRGITL